MRRSNLLIWLPYYDNNIILQIKRQEVFVILLESLKKFLIKIVHFVKKYSYTGQTRQHRRKKALVLHPSAVFLGCFYVVALWVKGSINLYPSARNPREDKSKNVVFISI